MITTIYYWLYVCRKCLHTEAGSYSVCPICGNTDISETSR